ncbi:unnamed protein product [Periconia digitata]|uniref:Uncharacterized protein n=1 Tax=Periconia digitata TaxID=1303443 RepID=A0A9W4U6Z6_9PLEO|nr:unnamed protein product [Periconia digitata]
MTYHLRPSHPRLPTSTFPHLPSHLRLPFPLPFHYLPHYPSPILSQQHPLTTPKEAHTAQSNPILTHPLSTPPKARVANPVRITSFPPFPEEKHFTCFIQCMSSAFGLASQSRRWAQNTNRVC